MVKKAKDHLELNLTEDIKDNKKGFSKYTVNKRKTKENVLNGTGALMTWKMLRY